MRRCGCVDRTEFAAVLQCSSLRFIALFLRFESTPLPPPACNGRNARQAFKKMNNVLIDDRRIRVDFSQSVAKEW